MQKIIQVSYPLVPPSRTIISYHHLVHVPYRRPTSITYQSRTKRGVALADPIKYGPSEQIPSFIYNTSVRMELKHARPNMPTMILTNQKGKWSTGKATQALQATQVEF